jgi:CheY-like chemotaxis protein
MHEPLGDSSSATRRKVLVADDEPRVLHLLTLHLERAGYEVVQTTEGQGVLSLAQSALPDLILLDVMMPAPRVTGCDCVRDLRAEPTTAGIPIVLTSTKSADANVHMRCCGQNRFERVTYLYKPIMVDELLSTVTAGLAVERAK